MKYIGYKQHTTFNTDDFDSLLAILQKEKKKMDIEKRNELLHMINSKEIEMGTYEIKKGYGKTMSLAVLIKMIPPI